MEFEKPKNMKFLFYLLSTVTGDYHFFACFFCAYQSTIFQFNKNNQNNNNNNNNNNHNNNHNNNNNNHNNHNSNNNINHNNNINNNNHNDTELKPQGGDKLLLVIDNKVDKINLRIMTLD